MSVIRVEATALPDTASIHPVSGGRNLRATPTNDLRSSYDNDGRPHNPEGRIFFFQLEQFLSRLSSLFLPPRTTTITETVTVTNTFFIQ